MKYTVHIYQQVRIKALPVVADSPQKACKEAEKQVRFHAIFDNDLKQWTGAEHCEADDSSPNCFLVDLWGDEDYEKSVWFWSDGKTPLANVSPTLELLIQLLIGKTEERDREIIKVLIDTFKDEIPTFLGIDEQLDKIISKYLGSKNEK